MQLFCAWSTITLLSHSPLPKGTFTLTLYHILAQSQSFAISASTVSSSILTRSRRC